MLSNLADIRQKTLMAIQNRVLTTRRPAFKVAYRMIFALQSQVYMKLRAAIFFSWSFTEE